MKTETIDQAFEQQGANVGSSGLAYVPNSRVMDRMMMASVPLLNRSSVAVLIGVAPAGLAMIVHYPRTKNYDKLQIWKWEDIHYAKWKKTVNFQLYVERGDKSLNLVCIQGDPARMQVIEEALAAHFDANGKNKALVYEGESRTETKRKKVDKELVLRMEKKRSRKNGVERARKIAAFVVVGLMLGYIVLKGVFKLF